MHDAVPDQARAANSFWIGVLASFCREKKIGLELATCSAEELDECLRKFYGGLRAKTGGVYLKSSYLCAGSAIQRHFTNLKRSFNLRSDVSFKRSNEILDAVLKNNKATGSCKHVQHKDVLSEEDKTRLSSYFADVLVTDDTYKLQSFCWFIIARHFGLRGSEVFVQLRNNDVEFKRSESGEEFAVLRTDFLTKNSKGGINSKEFQTCGMIKDTTQVEAMTRLMSMLHKSQDRLFQRVLTGVWPTTGPWFCNAPLGHNPLSQMMPLLSVRANLSTRYTDHCVRARVVTDLKEVGYSNHEVCAIKGHQHQGSLAHYDRIDCKGSKRLATMADVRRKRSQASLHHCRGNPFHRGVCSIVGSRPIAFHHCMAAFTFRETQLSISSR